KVYRFHGRVSPLVVDLNNKDGAAGRNSSALAACPHADSALRRLVSHGTRSRPMSLIQIIDFETTQFDDMTAAVEEYRAATQGKRTSGRARTARDRNRPNHYVTIV